MRYQRSAFYSTPCDATYSKLLETAASWRSSAAVSWLLHRAETCTYMEEPRYIMYVSFGYLDPIRPLSSFFYRYPFSEDAWKMIKSRQVSNARPQFHDIVLLDWSSSTFLPVIKWEASEAPREKPCRRQWYYILCRSLALPHLHRS